MVRSEGLEPPTPWFEAWCSVIEDIINQRLTMHQIIELLPKTATNTLQSATVAARFRHCCDRQREAVLEQLYFMLLILVMN